MKTYITKAVDKGGADLDGYFISITNDTDEAAFYISTEESKDINNVLLLIDKALNKLDK